MAWRLATAFFGAILVHAAPCSATYSIVGSDSATREVGGTGTSCLGGSDVYIIYGAVPGIGVIHAQAQYNMNARDRGVELLEQGSAPADIIAAITAASFDSNARARQYGVADATGRTAGFTGMGAQAFADDRRGTAGTFSYSVQGNILTSEAVLTQAAAAFEAPGCDLAERLMRALEAGADNGEGDSRCTPDGIPSDSSFIQVERPDSALGSYLELHVRRSGSESPIPGLREQFDEWRATHPCPGSGGGSGGSGGGAGTSGAGGSSPATGGSGATTGGVSGTGGVPGGSGPGSGGAPGAGAPSGGVPSAGSSSAGSASSAASDSPKSDDSAGCGCKAVGRHGGPVALPTALVLVLVALRRRKRRG